MMTGGTAHPLGRRAAPAWQAVGRMLGGGVMALVGREGTPLPLSVVMTGASRAPCL